MNLTMPAEVSSNTKNNVHQGRNQELPLGGARGMGTAEGPQWIPHRR